MEERENGEQDVNEANKENDKPKALKNKATSSGKDEQPCKKQRTKAPKRKDVGGKSNAEKEIEAEQNKLQKSVQQARVNNILQQRQPTTVVIPDDSPSTPPLPQVQLPLQESHITRTVASSHSPTQQSPATHTTIQIVPHFQTITITTILRIHNHIWPLHHSKVKILTIHFLSISTHTLC